MEKEEINQWIEEWVEALSEPDLGVNGAPLCPYAKNAWNKGQVDVQIDQDLWGLVTREVDKFDGTYRVVMCVGEESNQDYFEVEAACNALNNWFALKGLDIWLLSYQEDKTVVFIQRLSDLDDAADTLHKLGYYENYDADDYQRLIQQRRKLRRRFENARNDARKESA